MAASSTSSPSSTGSAAILIESKTLESVIEIPTAPAADVKLPHEVERLYDIAFNLWWTWSPEAHALFSSIDSETWTRYSSPLAVLTNTDHRRWQELLDNETFMSNFERLKRSFDSYLEGVEDAWFRRRYPDFQGGPIVYFSMEYGLHHSLPIYSGGLGVLSGDHCKSSSDLGLPFVALGLLYRHGYFRQTVDADGYQQHFYPELDFSWLPIRQVVRRTGQELVVQVPFPGRDIEAKVWSCQVGRVPLLLLDADLAFNDAADRAITGSLYVRGREMRLAQELLLGVGGVRALKALGIEPSVWHVNEGHSALLHFERLAQEIDERPAPFVDALARIRRNQVFTTHTPVPAGHEQFAAELAEKYLAGMSERLSAPVDSLLRLGSTDHGGERPPLNLTALALRTSSWVNGVSRLNAEVSNRMWDYLSGQLALAGGRIQAITNGVHLPTWVGSDMRELLGRHLGHRWDDGDEVDWRRVEEIPDEELWSAHLAQKQRLARFTRGRLLEQFARHGRSPDELRRVGELLDPEALTLGFARRFATYKRADLLFTDLHRLRALLRHPERPVQIILAGKAHPADRPGQQLIQHIFQLSQGHDLVGRVFFVENYDMLIARRMVQGVDVWLNTPRRPLEASGTSGQKAAVNGVLNCSIPDGWWPEGYNGRNGWTIEPSTETDDEGRQDQEEARALYEILEEGVVPCFYERDSDGLPRRWITMMKESIASIGAAFSSSRMVRDYVENAYVPQASDIGRRSGPLTGTRP